MAAIILWVRSTLRRHWGATLALALLAGLAAGLVGAAFQAARRADGAVDRYAARSRSFDLIVFGCPPGIDADPETNPDFDTQCISAPVADRLRTELLAQLPEVEAATTLGILIAGVLTPDAPNGWGDLILLYGTGGSSPSAGFLERQILVDGRYPSATAADELLIGERAAEIAGIHVGDTIRLASWSEENRDAATDGRLPPETEAFENRVVGIVRFGGDVQRTRDDQRGGSLPDALYAGPGWMSAHGADFASYGVGAGVRLRDGPGGNDAFSTALDAVRGDWSVFSDNSTDVDEASIRRVIDAERQAVLVFALIALLATVAFVGLIMVRQLDRELEEAPTLSALGLTRGRVLAAMVVRALVVGVLGALVAVATIVLLSPVGPVGIARRLEYSSPIRIDWVVLALIPAGLVLFFTGLTIGTVGLARHTGRRGVGAGLTGAVPLGPVPRTAVNFARGSSPRVAIGVGAVAVAVAVAAATLLASFSRVVAQPVRYGAAWDVAVGEYSDPAALQDGMDRLKANPTVAEAAAVLEDPSAVTLDGVAVPFLALLPVIGRPEPVMSSGRAPVAADEVALGADTAHRVHKKIGDTVLLTWTLQPPDEPVMMSRLVRVTGIAVLNNPVSSRSNAGDGVVINPDLAQEILPGSVAQALTVRFSPAVDRAVARESVRVDFPGSMRAATPPADIGNLERIRFVPWLIAALIGVLALAALVHALVTLLQRHARDLAVLAAIGFTRGQRRRVGLGASIVIVGASVLIGVPLGLVVGRWMWRVVSRRISIPSGPVTAWGPTFIAPLVALAIALTVAGITARWVTRGSPAERLRTE